MFYKEIDKALTIMDIDYIWAKYRSGFSLFKQKDLSSFPIMDPNDLRIFGQFNLVGLTALPDWRHILADSATLTYSEIPILIKDARPDKGIYATLSHHDLYYSINSVVIIDPPGEVKAYQGKLLFNYAIGFNPLYINNIAQIESYIVRKDVI